MSVVNINIMHRDYHHNDDQSWLLMMQIRIILTFCHSKKPQIIFNWFPKFSAILNRGLINESLCRRREFIDQKRTLVDLFSLAGRQVYCALVCTYNIDTGMNFQLFQLLTILTQDWPPWNCQPRAIPEVADPVDSHQQQLRMDFTVYEKESRVWRCRKNNE